MVHQLSKDGLAEIHPSLSERHRGRRGRGFGLRLRRKSSNRKIQVQPQTPDLTRVRPQEEILAGQPCRRILRIEVGQQANEFDAAVAVFHARRDVTILEIQRCQYGTGAQPLVFVVAADCGMLAWHRRQVRRGIADGLDSRLLVHRNGNDIGSRLASGSSRILQCHILIKRSGPCAFPPQNQDRAVPDNT